MERPEGFVVPLHQSLVTPQLVVGAPRQITFLVGSISAALSFGMQVLWAGAAIWIPVHGIAAYLCRNDPEFFGVLFRAITHPSYLGTR